ncbi:MAG TPA: LAGLIDADG family homing endonuclease [Candidatus Nanoarchaeia archaeon]|nr:LAGLIDADG family homing endonuclease [Candidatus Nanoarchaeia archaeon]
MKLDLSRLPNSKENISLPEKITPELAEETGLHIGDGTMNFYKNGNRIKGSYALRGHIIDDKQHYDKKIKVLYKNLFDLNVSLRDIPSTGVYGFQKWSDDIINFKNKVLKLPLGKKLNIKIPKVFISNEKLMISVIRGIFDTDGTIYLEPKYEKLYPRIEIGTISKSLGEQLFCLINKLDIRTTKHIEIPGGNRHRVYKISVRGNEMLDKWMKEIDPHNPKHWKKYQYFIDNN